MSGKPVFAELSDEDVQKKFSQGEFPDDIDFLQHGLAMAGFWSLEFAKEAEELIRQAHLDQPCLPPPNASLVKRATTHIRQHPFAFGLQVVGGLAAITSVAVFPALAIAGFSSAGPVLGSAAAGWQSSIGIVQAGSLFAWCQSAAMGGAAAGAVQGLGLAGLGITAGASAPLIPGLKEKLKNTFSRGGS